MIFLGMLEAIKGGARESVNFEAFLFHSCQVATEFCEALAERSRAGVRVRVLLDGIGRAWNWITQTSSDSEKPVVLSLITIRSPPGGLIMWIDARTAVSWWSMAVLALPEGSAFLTSGWATLTHPITGARFMLGWKVQLSAS